MNHSEQELIDEITAMTKAWYEYVSGDHHKDRDCHWYIEQSWDYGETPTWTIKHYGYIFHKGKDGETQCKGKTHKDALCDLRKLIRKAFLSEINFANGVIICPEDYDNFQIKQAKEAKRLFAPFLEGEVQCLKKNQKLDR